MIDTGDLEAVHIAGDWHANWRWVRTALHQLADDGCRLLIHAGDFGYFPRLDDEGYTESVSALAGELGIHIVVVPGNHEDWDALDSLFAADPGALVPLAAHVDAAPRGYRLTAGGWTWWPQEVVTDADVERICAQDPVDVLITHDTPITGTLAVARQRGRPSSIPPGELALSDLHQNRIQYIADALRPRLHFHGHWHLPDSRLFRGDPPREVVSLGMDGDIGNLGHIDLSTLAWQTLEVAPV